MKPLRSAIQFLTIIPIGNEEDFFPEKMLPYFPLAGILIGLILALFDMIVLQFWPAPVAAVLDTIFLVILTGALHMDGLCDTADGLYGGSTKEKALSIMKDSRTGAIGVVAVICCFALKYAGILGIDSNRMILIIIVPAYARGGILFGFKFLNYGRPEGGTGYIFSKQQIKISSFWALLIPFFISLLLGWKFVLINLCFIAAVASILVFYKKRIGCITGDMLGALTEILEGLLFLVGAINI
jgi:adenosylcobinamide-GDP ribazoletransferase